MTTRTMHATFFHGPGDIRVEDVPRPHVGPGEALIRVTTITICGTDLHIVKGEYPVRPGLVIGHESVGVIAELGAGVTGYKVGDRVLVGAIACSWGRSRRAGNACLSGHHSQCGHGNDCEGARRLAVREHDRRCAGGVSARTECAGEHGRHPGKLEIPYDAFGAGLADVRIVTTLYPGGKERMRPPLDMVHSGHQRGLPRLRQAARRCDEGSGDP